MRRLARLRLRRLLAARRGSIAVEAAFIVPVVVLMMIGVINYGGAMMARTELFNAVHAGLQYALIAPTNTSGMQTAVTNASSKEFGAGSITVTAAISCVCSGGGGTIASSCSTAACPTASGGDGYQLATITATQTYNYLVKFPGFPTSVTFSETASIRNLNN